MKDAASFRWSALTGLIALVLGGCGGGGDAGGPTGGSLANAQQAEVALAAKLAAIALWVTPLAPGLSAAVDRAYGELWHQTPGTSLMLGRSCLPQNWQKLGTGSTSVDTITTINNCTFSRADNGTGAGQSFGSGTRVLSLVMSSNPALPTDSAWLYEDRSLRQGSREFYFSMLNGLAMEGKASWNSLTEVRADHSADGSQSEVTKFSLSGAETSQRGNSNFAVHASFTCKFASPAAYAAGDCAMGTSRLDGTVYGQRIDAPIVAVAGSVGSYAIEHAGVRISFAWESQSDDFLFSRLRVKTTSGLDFVLLGEDLNWLAPF